MLDYSKFKVAGPWDRRAGHEELLADIRHVQAHRNRASFLSGTVNDLVYQNAGNFTAVNSTAVEATMLGGINEQPWLPAGFLTPPSPVRRALLIEASGVFSNTGTPTLTFTARLSSTQGSATITGTVVGITAAITTSSGVTNVFWTLWLRLQLFSPGQGAGAASLQCNGLVHSPAGFASPFAYALAPSAPPTATWSQTIDGSLNQYVNLDATWSASSASNTIQVKSLLMHALG